MSMKHDDDLTGLLDEVEDEKTFLKFVKALYEEKIKENEIEKQQSTSSYDSGGCGWENNSIEAFLESAHAWAEDSDFGSTQNLEDTPLWKKFAVFLYMGKIYE